MLNVKKRRRIDCRLFLLLVCFYAAHCDAEMIKVSNFENQSLEAWQHKSFKALTQYQPVSLNNKKVLQAKSQGTASSLYKEVRIDLQKTPYLNWSWRIDKKLAWVDESQKQGDDFAARIYLVIKGEWFFWQTKAINYVWARQSPQEANWANPFTGDSVRMVAIRSNGDHIEQWYTEKRDVLVDFRRFFGDDIRFIDGIALMTDTDNASGDALSYYADIYFSEK